jgi:cbb3-type cytochrome oxidase cytochrome c subunit
MTNEDKESIMPANPCAEQAMITIGAMAADLSTQLDALGVDYDQEAVSQLSRDMRAVARLSIGGYLTKKQTCKMHDRIAKRLRKATR